MFELRFEDLPLKLPVVIQSQKYWVPPLACPLNLTLSPLGPHFPVYKMEVSLLSILQILENGSHGLEGINMIDCELKIPFLPQSVPSFQNSFEDKKYIMV